ncbi:hypothetical protein MRX96_006730 [Rhipicephalus microplus]
MMTPCQGARYERWKERPRELEVSAPECLVPRHCPPKRHPDTVDEFQASSPITDAKNKGCPRSRDRSGGRCGSSAAVPPRMFQLALQADRMGPGKLHF